MNHPDAIPKAEAADAAFSGPLACRATRRIPTFALLALVAAAIFTGCVVTSVCPFYTDKDLVFDPVLIGDWVLVGTNQTAGYVRLERLGDKGYWATTFASDETNSTELHLFRLKKQLFFDACSTNRSLDFVPVHQLVKVSLSAAGLETANLNYDWLTKRLAGKPRELRHIVIYDQPREESGPRLVLTASTTELERFVLRYLHNTNAWDTPSKWKRRPGP